MPTTRGLLIGSPGNPTGAAMTRDELIPIAEFAAEHDLLVYSDEIYDRLVYDGHEHTCFASLPGMRDRTVVLNGFSKAFAMTGLRIGYLCAPEDIAEAANRVHQYAAMCSATQSQIGALHALRSAEEDVRRMVAEYDRRRRYLVHALCEIGLDCPMPQGAFYVFPSTRALGLNGREFATRLLTEERVAVVPGSAFGPSGEYNVRATYATSLEQLRVAVERIGRLVRRIREERR